MSTEKVLETMKKAGRPLRTGEISQLSGLDKKEVEKAIKELKKAEKIESPARCLWQPK
ncbi:MAG TPA: transcriptional regulator [Salinivirgaceae bacterium]|nr:transcriptional regulator [Salinivirgaceae bacterium]